MVNNLVFRQNPKYVDINLKNEQLTTLIKSLNVNVEVGSKHVKLDIETMLENTC